MYQLEVKRYLIENMFHPRDGWNVLVDIDAMERAKGDQQKPDKKERVEIAEQAIVDAGASIGAHPIYGRVDVIATHPELGTYLIEVEGKSSKQKEQAMYSALGQTILLMDKLEINITYVLAVPDQKDWEFQINKIPTRIKNMLNMECFLVSKTGVRKA